MTKEVVNSGCRLFDKYFPGLSWATLIVAYAII